MPKVKSILQTAQLEKEVKSKHLHDFLGAIYRLEAEVVTDIVSIGKIWCEIHDNKLWKYSGNPECTTFRDFCEKECMRSHTTVYSFMEIFRKFGGLLLEGVALDHTRLIRALPYVKTEEQAKEWVSKAATLNKVDYEDFLREAQGKLPTDTCLHPENQQENWQRCKVCGKFRK